MTTHVTAHVTVHVTMHVTARGRCGWVARRLQCGAVLRAASAAVAGEWLASCCMRAHSGLRPPGGIPCTQQVLTAHLRGVGVLRQPSKMGRLLFHSRRLSCRPCSTICQGYRFG